MRKINFLPLLVLFSISACYRDANKYIQQNKKDILKVYSDVYQIPADGKSIATITAKLSNDADNRAVKFVTNRGNFLDSTLSYSTTATIQNDSIIAKVFLVAPTDTTSYATVTVNASGIDSIIKLTFIPAYPDKIHIETTTGTTKSGFGSEVTVQVFLSRLIGIPSIHQKVEFVATKDNNETIGSFRGISLQGSDQNGQINATFQLKDATYTGRLKITASFINSVVNLKDSTYIFITN
jgi:hypothetical protein